MELPAKYKLTCMTISLLIRLNKGGKISTNNNMCKYCESLIVSQNNQTILI